MIKHSGATLDYRIDWSAWLDTDTIATSTWSADPGITKQADFHDSHAATVWLSGGTAGQSYTVTNTITTADGRTEQRALTIIVEDL